MKIKEQLEKILNDIVSLKKINLKQLHILTETNDFTNLVEITLTLVKIIKKSQKAKEQHHSVIDVIQQKKILIQTEPHPASISILDIINTEDCILLLNILFILKDKLSSTIYEWIIKDIANEFIIKIKDMKCYEEIKKDLINEMTKSFLDENYLDPQKQESVKKLLKQGLFENIDSIVSRFQNYVQVYNFFYLKIVPILTAELETIKPKEKINFLYQCLTIIKKFIFPLQLQILVQKNALSQNRRFRPIIQRQFLQSYSRIISALIKIFNQILLIPAQIELQTNLFIILRRMYYLWGAPIRNPLFTNIVNISLFSKNETDLKQAAIFCYKIVTQKQDIQLLNLIQNSQYLTFLKDSPYYSSKAYAFLNDISPIYNTNQLNLPFWKLKKNIESGDLWYYNIVVDKSGTLLTWQFEVLGYDIKFGLYKIENMKKLDINQYQSQKNCKAVIKATKYANSKTPHKGSLFLKSGIYRFILDNTYSYLRSKEILYSFHLFDQL